MALGTDSTICANPHSPPSASTVAPHRRNQPARGANPSDRSRAPSTVHATGV